MNANISPFRCFVREEYFTKSPSDKFYNCLAFGVQSLSGKVLTFHVITDFGMLRSRVPVYEIRFTEGRNDREPHFYQLWDCFSENVKVVEYDYLAEKRCQIILKDKTKIWATYLMTVDWYNNAYSDEPQDYKCGHLLIGDDGALYCMPNNRLFWSDMNFITKPFPIDPKLYKVDTELLSVESFSKRWVSEDTDSFYYDVTSLD